MNNWPLIIELLRKMLPRNDIVLSREAYGMLLMCVPVESRIGAGVPLTFRLPVGDGYAVISVREGADE